MQSSAPPNHLVMNRSTEGPLFDAKSRQQIRDEVCIQVNEEGLTDTPNDNDDGTQGFFGVLRKIFGANEVYSDEDDYYYYDDDDERYFYDESEVYDSSSADETDDEDCIAITEGSEYAIVCVEENENDTAFLETLDENCVSEEDLILPVHDIPIPSVRYTVQCVNGVFVRSTSGAVNVQKGADSEQFKCIKSQSDTHTDPLVRKHEIQHSDDDYVRIDAGAYFAWLHLKRTLAVQLGETLKCALEAANDASKHSMLVTYIEQCQSNIEQVFSDENVETTTL